MSLTDKKTAEQMFRESFERLKRNSPDILPKDTPVTQNNVAREAGRDPSALKKDRYPILVLEIQAYLTSQKERQSGTKKSTDNRSRTDKQKLADLRNQRDKLCSIVEAQDNYIEELLDEIERLKSGKVVKI